MANKKTKYEQSGKGSAQEFTMLFDKIISTSKDNNK